MSRAPEQRAIVRDRFGKLCDALERRWVGAEEAQKILDASGGSFDWSDIAHALGVSRTANPTVAYDNLQDAMREYFRALNGLPPYKKRGSE